MFLKQCQAILRYGLQGGSLSRKLLLTGFLAMHVRADVDMFGMVKWTTNAKKWKDRWVFLHSVGEETLLYRFEEPSVFGVRFEYPMQIDEESGGIKKYVVDAPSAQKCQQVLDLGFGVCTESNDAHTKDKCLNEKMDDGTGRQGHARGIISVKWRNVMKKLDITKKWGGHYKKVPYSRRCDDLHYVPVLLSLPKTERESRGPCHVSFEFHMLDSSPRCLRFQEEGCCKVPKLSGDRKTCANADDGHPFKPRKGDWIKAFTDCGLKPRTRRRRLKTPFEKLVDEIDSLSEK